MSTPDSPQESYPTMEQKRFLWIVLTCVALAALLSVAGLVFEAFLLPQEPHQRGSRARA